MGKKQADLMRERGYLSVPEVARRCGRDTMTVYRWITEKKVVSVTIVERHYIELKSLIAHLGYEGAVKLGIIAEKPPAASDAAAPKAASG